MFSPHAWKETSSVGNTGGERLFNLLPTVRHGSCSQSVLLFCHSGVLLPGNERLHQVEEEGVHQGTGNDGNADA